MKQVLVRDKPHLKPISIQLLSKVGMLEKEFKRVNKLRSPAYDVLMVIVSHYVKSGLGITVYHISKCLNPNNTRGQVISTNDKIRGLLIDNVIEISGYGRYASHVYIPTQRVLKELQEMCDKINEG